MKEEQKQEWDANTLCIPYITPPLPACIVYDCREGRGVITQSVSIPFLFLFFFHQSSLYPIKIFAKCLYIYMYRDGKGQKKDDYHACAPIPVFPLISS